MCLLSLLLCMLSMPRTARAAASEASLRAAALEILVDGHLAGSACFVTPFGLALTAAHVVAGGVKIEVLSAADGRLGARVVAKDLGHDLALLLVERPAGLFPVVALADAAPVAGTPLNLYGSALYRHGLLLPGTVARGETHYEWNSANRCYAEIQAVAAMTPEGLSGAPWVDGEGRLAGVQSGMIVKAGGLAGVAFMSPLGYVRRLVATRQSIASATLGAQFAEPWEWSPPGTPGRGLPPVAGLYVIDVLSGGPLAAAGIVAGERVVAVNGSHVSYRDQLLAQVRRFSPGETVTLAVETMSGERRSVAVEVADCGNF